jgi:hypothetical protein
VVGDPDVLLSTPADDTGRPDSSVLDLAIELLLEEG